MLALLVHNRDPATVGGGKKINLTASATVCKAGLSSMTQTQFKKKFTNPLVLLPILQQM